MSDQRQIDLLLKELGASMGMEELTFDENGGCVLQFDEVLNVLLLYEQHEDVLYLFSFVGELQKGKKEKMMRHLLEANYRWTETGGATLSLREDEDNVVLTRKLKVESLTREHFEQTLSHFVTSLEKWMGYLKDPSSLKKENNKEESSAPLNSSSAIRA